MVTEEADNGTEDELDLSSGMVPHHNLGPWTGIDHDTGLPIVKRMAPEKPAEPQPAPEKPAAKPEAKEEKPELKQDDAPAKPAALAKGSAVSMPDGSTGKISYLDSQLKIARVSKDKGGSSTHPLSKLKAADSPEAKDVPAGHIFVKSHLRPLPEKPK